MTATLDRPALYGSTTPRLWTRPLVTGPEGPCGCGCALTPDTSLGFEAVDFAGLLGVTLLPWQRWWLIHALELRPDGTFRFRTALTLVGRQNGKSWLLKVVALWAMAMGHARMVLGAAQSLDIARESWQGAVELADGADDLRAEIAKNGVRRANGEQTLTLTSGARYRITAATRSAGRGLSVDLLILDELREHRDWLAWSALSKTTTARPNALTVPISNAGDDGSVVLNALREAAIAGTDDGLGLFEWSAPDDCELDDPDGWAWSNPALGHVPSIERTIRGELTTDPPAVFRTERLCQRVDQLDGAIDLAAWKSAGDPTGTLESVRERIGLVVDVAPDGQHVTAIGAAVLDDGRVRVEVLGAWDSTEVARRELFGQGGALATMDALRNPGDDPGLFALVRPYVVGWFPGGPAGALGAEFKALGKAAKDEIDRGTKPSRRLCPDVVGLEGVDVAQACQGLADMVRAGRVLHPNDELLNAHVGGAQKLFTGDGWRFVRKGAGHVDAAYACAGAVQVVRTVPPPPKNKKAAIF